MPLTGRELQKLRTRCNKLQDGPDHRIDDYVTNVLVTVLDFQMLVPTLSSALKHYEEHHGYRTHKKLKELVSSFPNTRGGNLRLAKSLWGNCHWTRAKFLRIIIFEFDKRGINGQQSLKKWVSKADFKNDVQGKFKVSTTENGHHSIGPALFQWLRLRLGMKTVKADVHIIRFVSAAIGRKVSQQEAFDSLIQIADQTGRNASRLDAAIWYHQRKKA